MPKREVQVNLKVEDLVDVKAMVDKLIAARDAAVARAEQAEALIREMENAITWDTTCLNCSKLLDQCYAETARAEQAEQAVARVRAEVAEQIAQAIEAVEPPRWAVVQTAYDDAARIARQHAEARP